MDKGKIAERVLSVAMDPVRAAAVSGDLLEAGGSRNSLWFWSNVFQTFLAIVWRDARARPLFVIGLAVRGAVVQCAICFSVALPIVELTVSHQSLAQKHPLWFIPFGLVYDIFAPYYAGRWVAKRSLGKELAICVVMTIVAPFIIAGTSLPLTWVVSLINGYGHMESAALWLHWWEIGFLLPYLAGALLVRRRRQMAGAA
jgi:hypothetical protein